MKFSQYIFLLIYMTVASASWLQPLLIKVGLSQSRIPRFIRDLNHPFVNDNRGFLEGLSDPIELLCDPSSPLQELLPAFPQDLFKRLNVDNNRVSQGISGWTNAREVLSDILRCKAALDSVEEFTVDIYLQAGGRLTFGEAPTPSRDILDLFAQFFANAPRLNNLIWIRPFGDFDAFERYFVEHSVQIPSVTSLVIGPNMQFLIASTPNVQSLSSAWGLAWSTYSQRSLSHSRDGPQFRIVDSLSLAKQLKEFTLHATWTPDLVSELVKKAPGLEKLALDGDLDGQFTGQNLRELAKKLNKLDNLKELQLPDVFHLGLSSYDFPDCGNAYFGVYGRILRRQYALEFSLDMEKAGELLLPEMPRLRRLCIGDDCIDIAQGEKLRWPWTGRLQDYLLESVPRYKGEHHWEDPDHEDPHGPVLGTWAEDDKWFPGHQKLSSPDFQNAKLGDDPSQPEMRHIVNEL